MSAVPGSIRFRSDEAMGRRLSGRTSHASMGLVPPYKYVSTALSLLPNNMSPLEYRHSRCYCLHSSRYYML